MHCHPRWSRHPSKFIIAVSRGTDNSRSGFDTALRSRAATAVTYPKRSTGSTRQLTVKVIIL
ncbi:hypothetical protein E2C01_050541 [Portunus trituberculatus]|uniref:Uncharacterized protein n=1 Tax=Portunus trituberculatus TaxID=210409 RepID=A0A5B7GHT7_PORTR|nr:hypothetical protein [Portunus trituberculatus]